MDADAIGPILAAGGAALALLGRRRRSSHDTATVGERLNDGTNNAIDAVTGTAHKAGTGITDLSVTSAAVAMYTTVTGAAGVVRAAGHATTTVVTGVVELLGHGASRSGGLILDGGVFLIDGLVEPLRGRHDTPALRATPGDAVTIRVGRVPESPTLAKMAPATKAPAERIVSKKAAARKSPAKKAPAKRIVAKNTAARKSSAKKAPAKKVVSKNAAARKAPSK